MQVNYDFTGEEWIAFLKKDGKPYLSFAPSYIEALSLISEMVEEDKDEK